MSKASKAEWADETRHSHMRHVKTVHMQNRPGGGAYVVELVSVRHPESSARGYTVVVHTVAKGWPSKTPADWKRATMVSEIGRAEKLVEAYAIGWAVGRWAKQRI